MRAPNNRKGFSGWKLTKRPNELLSEIDSSSLQNIGSSSQFLADFQTGMQLPNVGTG